MKAYILQVTKDKFNERYYSYFDNLCSQTKTINNNEYWIFPVNIHLNNQEEEIVLLNLLLLHFKTSGYTHLQIMK